MSSVSEHGKLETLEGGEAGQGVEQHWWVSGLGQKGPVGQNTPGSRRGGAGPGLVLKGLYLLLFLLWHYGRGRQSFQVRVCFLIPLSRLKCAILPRADHTREGATMNPDKGGALWLGFFSATGVTTAADTRGGYMIASVSTLAATTSSWTSIPLTPAWILSKPSKKP